MLLPFDLSVPSDDRYRSLASEVAVKYAELAGRPPAAAQALGADVGRVSDELAQHDRNIALEYVTGEQAVEVKIECAGKTAKVTSR